MTIIHKTTLICVTWLLFFPAFVMAQKDAAQNPSQAKSLKKVEFTLFETDFGYETQTIDFDNFSLCRHFHYKMINNNQAIAKEMKVDARADCHYLLENDSWVYHIVFLDFNVNTGKINFGIGKPPHYKHQGSLSTQVGVDPDYNVLFTIPSAYTIRLAPGAGPATEYMVVFFCFMVPNNTYLESCILLFCKTLEGDFSYRLLPYRQISTSPYAFMDYNCDGWLDYIHFNPYAAKPEVSFYDGKGVNFIRNSSYKIPVSYTGDQLFAVDSLNLALPDSCR